MDALIRSLKRDLALEFTCIKLEIFILGNGSRILSPMGFIYLKTVKVFKELLKGESKELACIDILMEIFIMAIGKMISKMEKV